VINWRAELQDFFDAKVPNDYSFLSPNRRYAGYPVIMPGLDGVNLGSIIFAADTSGSVSKAELQQVSGEIISVNDDLEPETLHVLWWDTRVSAQTFEQGDTVDLTTLKPQGGGGTRVDQVFDWIEENEPEPVAVVILTDGHFWNEPEDPGYPVLWAITDKDKYKKWDIPFGDALYIKID
jgi:predicted metal-dependent peptidase